MSETGAEPFLSDLTIGAFRGLRNVRLENLGRINLLVGPNNCGKTSVLEAMAVVANPLDLRKWVEVARSRELPSLPLKISSILPPVDAIRWLFPYGPSSTQEESENSPILLEGKAVAGLRHLEASCTPIHGIPPEREIRINGMVRVVRHTDEDNGWLVRVCLTGPDDTPDVEEYPIWYSQGVRIDSRKNDKNVRVSYLTPYAHRNQAQTLSRQSKAVRGGYKEKIDGLINSLDPNLAGVEITTSQDGSRPLLEVRRRQGDVVPISILGDGVRRALSLALAVPPARDGLLLIDEIESALHVSALDRIYPWLVEACTKFNVQLVATTHSLEAVDALARLDYDGPRELAAYHLSGEEEEAKRYSGGMLRRLVHEKGLDVR